MNRARLATFRNGELPTEHARRVDDMPEFWRVVRDFHHRIMSLNHTATSRLGNEFFTRQDLRLTGDTVFPAAVHRGAIGLGRALGLGELIVMSEDETRGNLRADVFRYTLSAKEIDVAHNVIVAEPGLALQQGDRIDLNDQDFRMFVAEMHRSATATGGVTGFSDQPAVDAM